VLLMSVVGRCAIAADWTQWRGPERNGLGPKGPALANSLAGLSPLWMADRIPSGDQGGRGGLVVHGGKVYGLLSAASKASASDEVFCLDAANGKTLWKSKVQEASDQAGSSTPCIGHGKLYVVSSGGHACCLNAET